MAQYPFVSIIIPTKNEEILIGKCLDSLKGLNYPKESFEVIISDGLSSDNTVKIAQSYGARVVSNEKQIVAAGRNVGFRFSRGEIIAFSDADCLMDKDWLNNALKYFRDEKVAGIGGPNLVPENESPFGRAVRFLFLIGSVISGSVQTADSKKTKETKSIPGCNSIYKREALDKVMPSDETLLTCDDTDINYCLRERGYKLLYVPDVIVCHYRRDNPKKFYKQIYRYAIGRLQIAKRHKGAINAIHILFGFSIPIFIFLTFVLNILYLLLFLSILFLVFIGLVLIKEKSLKVALNACLAGLIFVIAWSTGFLRELIFPMKNPAGK